jgi:uncharacterized membrane protein (UPF0136 family)
LVILILFISIIFFTFAGMIIGYLFRSEETAILGGVTVGAILIFISNLIASGLTLLVLLPFYTQIKFKFDSVLWKKMMRYAMPVLIAGIAYSVNETFDRILLEKLLPADIAEEQISRALQKRIPTQEDLNPQKRFINNKVIDQLRNNISFTKYISSNKLSWVQYPHIPRLIHKRMVEWDIYKEYMASDNNNYLSDRKFVIKLITELILRSED